jgi:23S rRNA pseudouridine1911/1915/1917 synthase
LDGIIVARIFAFVVNRGDEFFSRDRHFPPFLLKKRKGTYMEILYTDPDIVVAVKPCGVISEAGEGSMPALLEAHVPHVLPVHRLDRGVSGVMVYARHKRAAAALCESVRAGALKKIYTAVVSGVPEPREGELRHLLYHDARANKSFPVDRARAGAKEAILRYRVTDVTEQDGHTLSRLCVELETGRTHQIRVQLAAVG